MKPSQRNLIGERFNLLTVQSVAKNKKGHIAYLCKCDCGGTKTVVYSALVRGTVKSCGCIHGTPTHGKTKTHEYRCWSAMKARCTGKKGQYQTYVDNGIKVCDEWITSFETFLNDMGIAPTPKHTIDRIDNNKGYSKDNCRWATPKEQNRNYSQNVIIAFNGEKHCVMEWAEKLNIPPHRIYQRLRYGWPVSQALEMEPRIRTR
jgi:hypothetical protein